MRRPVFITFILFTAFHFFAQLPVGRDTLTVIENDYVQKMPWAGGLNFCQFSQLDLDGDGKDDLIAFDKISSNINGVFRCFLNTGGTGQADYRFDYSYAAQLPAAYYWASFYDYNKDGKADFFTYVIGGIKVYRNTSTPGNLSFQLLKFRLNSNYNPGGIASYGNIPSNGIAVPGFSDVDSDGDMDIIVFSTTGTQIEYHQNKSKELYGHADSLIYDMVDACWGDIAENNCQVILNNCPLRPLYEKAVEESHKSYHAGACLMCFDRDDDGDQDVVLGDISCNKVTYMGNAGSSSNAHISDTSSAYPNYQLPVTPIIRMNNFPCTYYMDIDNDNKKDIIACPNLNGSENYKSVWFYRNNGSATADFQFVKNNFLQDEMIEVGEGAYPVLFDYDDDGLLDLIIGNAGYYVNNSLKSRLTLYKNTGSLSQPSYSLITRDFAAISSTTIANRIRIVPTFGDIDGDGDSDMLLGDASGDIHWYENTAGAGTTCNFSNFKFDCFGITTASNSYPQLIDVNRDGLLDLIAGTLNGKLAYYRNTGTVTTPSFSFVTNSFGGINVNTNPSNFLGDGSCAPFMYDESGVYKLLCGSVNGHVFLYDNIDGNLGGNFNRVDTMINNIYEGANSTVQYIDINGDSKRDLITGNYCGGLNFYSSKKPIGVQEWSADESGVLVFPNPAHDVINIRVYSASAFVSELTDISGRTILKSESKSSYCTLNVQAVSSGIYLLKIISKAPGKPVLYKKLIIE